jgi:transcriptional regulator with XRE-family HTH domain
MNITGKQIAMARILLDLSQKELSDKLGIARKTIMRIENEQSPGSTKTLEAIKNYFENAGLEFLENNGVQENKNPITKLSGKDGMRTFFDMVYESAQIPSQDICLFNGMPERLLYWLGQEWYENHIKRMTAIQTPYKYKIIVRHGDTKLIGKDFAEYRWFPKDLFNEKTLHSFGNKIAFFNFSEDDVEIIIIDQPVFAESFRILFNIAWERVAITPAGNKG